MVEKFEISWKNGGGKKPDPKQDIDEEWAQRRLANKFGDDAIKQLKEKGMLETDCATLTYTK